MNKDSINSWMIYLKRLLYTRCQELIFSQYKHCKCLQTMHNKCKEYAENSRFCEILLHLENKKLTTGIKYNIEY